MYTKYMFIVQDFPMQVFLHGSQTSARGRKARTNTRHVLQETNLAVRKQILIAKQGRSPFLTYQLLTWNVYGKIDSGGVKTPVVTRRGIFYKMIKTSY